MVVLWWPMAWGMVFVKKMTHFYTNKMKKCKNGNTWNASFDIRARCFRMIQKVNAGILKFFWYFVQSKFLNFDKPKLDKNPKFQNRRIHFLPWNKTTKTTRLISPQCFYFYQKRTCTCNLLYWKQLKLLICNLLQMVLALIITFLKNKTSGHWNYYSK